MENWRLAIMKNMKRIASAAISAAMLAGMAGTGLLANLSTTASAAGNQTVHSVTSSTEWNRRINNEKAKYPATKNGKKCYWNRKWNSITGKYGDEDSYSTTPCSHNSQGYCNDCNTLQMSAVHGNYYTTGYNLITNSYGSSVTTYSQCIGFACKLALDLWQTDTFIQYDIKSGKIQYGDGSSENYVPKVGDNVRIFAGGYEHSIFITYVNGDDIRFAQCNADNKCGIEWDVNYYNGSGVTQAYLRSRAKYVERPAIAGDLNLNGRIDNGDAAIFESTVMYDGNPVGAIENGIGTVAPYSAYDVNGDGHVDTTDLNQIKYGSNHPDYMRLISRSDETTCRWAPINNINGFRFSDGSYYVKNDIGGVSWIGSVDKEATSVSVPTSVYHPKDKKWYTVNEIGYNAQHRGGGWRTCTAGYKIKTLRIPDSITKIHSFAFESWEMTSLQFSGSNPKLEIIDEYAFYDCQKLTSLNFTPCTKLNTVGDYAFNNCKKLATVIFPTTTNSSSSAQMNMKFGKTYGMFNDASTRTTCCTLYFMNNASSYRTVILTANDIAMIRSGKLAVCLAGKVRIKDSNGNILLTYSNSQLMQVHP